MRAVLGLLVAVLMLAGCGIRPQERPETLGVPRPSTADPGATTASGDAAVSVYFVRGVRLELVPRQVPRRDVNAALDALLVGPTRSEVLTGLRTALSPQSLMPEQAAPAAGLVTIAVDRVFTDVSGGNQLLAVAQVVWTVTEFPEVNRVRITADGQPVEVPTDGGLTNQPVAREDYRSVTPEDADDEPGAPVEPSLGTNPTEDDPAD